MKIRTLVLISLVTACLVPTAGAQSYTIDWFNIGGGGGNISAGPYSVSSTIGQPGASLPFAGGNYSIVGGFWSPVAVVHLTGTPDLGIILTVTNTVVIYWAWPSTGWTLQQNVALGATNWTLPSETITHDAVNNLILVNSPSGNRVFRLSNKP